MSAKTKEQLHKSNPCTETSSVLFSEQAGNNISDTYTPAKSKTICKGNRSNNNTNTVNCKGDKPVVANNTTETNPNIGMLHLTTCESCTVFMVCSEQKGKPPKFVRICDLTTCEPCTVFMVCSEQKGKPPTFVRICDNICCGAVDHTEEPDPFENICEGFQDIDLSYVPSCL